MKKNFALSALAAIAVVALAFTGCKDPEPVKVSSIMVSPATATLEIDETVTLSATVLPADAENKTYTWSSSADAIASVSNTGVVTAKSAGTATITATAADGSNVKGTATITVNQAVVPPVTAIAFASDLKLTEVNEFKYSEIVTAEGAPVEDLSVEVSSGSIGKITLKLTTDVVLINGVLAEMGLAEGFELGALEPDGEVAQTLAGFFGEGLPVGDAVKGKEQVELDFSAIQPLIAGLPGGVNQFDIEIKAEDEDSSVVSVTQTLKLKFIDDVSVTVAATENLDLAAVNEFTYSYIIDGEEGAPVPTAITVNAPAGIATLTLTLETDNAGLNTILGGMGLTEPFELGAPTPQQAAGLGMIGFPSGDAVVEKQSVALPLNQLLGTIAQMIPGGINQFDITIEATDANGAALIPAKLQLKFVDDVIVAITGDGIGADPLEIKKSEAGETPVKIAIAAPQGIDEFKVLIESTSPSFTTGLTAMSLTSEFDLANPDEALTASLAAIAATGIELPSGDAIKGEAAFEFDITGFIPMIFGTMELGAETECTADFKITVKDARGTSKSATVKLSLVDDSTPPAESGDE